MAYEPYALMRLRSMLNDAHYSKQLAESLSSATIWPWNGPTDAQLMRVALNALLAAVADSYV